MVLKSAVRRLLKSQLRLYIMKALAAERADESWVAVIEVEQGIWENAWAAWVKIRAAHALEEIARVAPAALDEAVVATLEAFEPVAPLGWLKEQINAYTIGFRSSQLMEDACGLATS